jgi:hypothetical protein
MRGSVISGILRNLFRQLKVGEEPRVVQYERLVEE